MFLHRGECKYCIWRLTKYAKNKLEAACYRNRDGTYLCFGWDIIGSCHGASHYRMDLINQPLLMIAGEKADTLYMTEDAYAKASGTENKELYMIEGASHIRTYWVPEYVDKAVNKLGAFFNKNL